MEQGISVICSTNKMGMMKSILQNFISQNYIKKELIIIINYNISNLGNLHNSILPFDNIHLYYLGSKISLGKCLNFGIEKSKYPIIAKFDDDDYYAPDYLSDTVGYLLLEDVGIVGKSCTYVYFSEEKIIGVKNIKNENKYTNRVAGSTLMFKKDLFEKVRFQDITLGEDIAFCNDCLNIGYKIYSTSRHNYVYIRNSKNKHTWKIDNDYILKRCIQLECTANYKEYVANSVNNDKKTYL